MLVQPCMLLSPSFKQERANGEQSGQESDDSRGDTPARVAALDKLHGHSNVRGHVDSVQDGKGEHTNGGTQLGNATQSVGISPTTQQCWPMVNASDARGQACADSTPSKRQRRSAIVANSLEVITSPKDASNLHDDVVPAVRAQCTRHDSHTNTYHGQPLMRLLDAEAQPIASCLQPLKHRQDRLHARQVLRVLLSLGGVVCAQSLNGQPRLLGRRLAVAVDGSKWDTNIQQCLQLLRRSAESGTAATLLCSDSSCQGVVQDCGAVSSLESQQVLHLRRKLDDLVHDVCIGVSGEGHNQNAGQINWASRCSLATTLALCRAGGSTRFARPRLMMGQWCASPQPQWLMATKTD